MPRASRGFPTLGRSSISRTPDVRERTQRLIDARNAIRDMVQPRAAPLEEPRDRRFGPERGDQLDVALADVEQGCVDSLFVDHLPVHERHPEDPQVDGDRRLQVGNGDTDVINPRQHAC